MTTAVFAMFGGWEVVFLLASLLVTAAVIAGVVMLVVWLNARNKPSTATVPSEPPPHTPDRCPRCQAPLPPHSPQGLCPRCVLGVGLAPQTEFTGDEAGPEGTRVVKEPPSVPDIAKHFPQLEILECLGRGGMGVVYKARQPKLNRFVALKIVAPEKGADPKFAERFLREAQSLARLSHPNIVTVHDFGEADGLHYLLMEYVDGLTLRAALRAGRMRPEEALAIVPRICEALQYAHDKGIVHRDIKPENVLLDKQGHVKIADFGIAKMVGGEEQPAHLTGEQVIGTPHYMAPEQVERPASVDHRADIYSLGVVFYEMLTGELPLGKFAAPSTKVSMDVRLDEVVLRSLEKEPERRYQQASQVRTAVETIASQPGAKAEAGAVANEGISSPRPSPAFHGGEGVNQRMFAWLALGLFLVGLLGTVFLIPLVAQDEWALVFGGMAWLLALVFGILSWRERVGRLVVIAVGTIAAGAIILVAVLSLAWIPYRRSEMAQVREAQMAQLQRQVRQAQESQTREALAREAREMNQVPGVVADVPAPANAELNQLATPPQSVIEAATPATEIVTNDLKAAALNDAPVQQAPAPRTQAQPPESAEPATVASDVADIPARERFAAGDRRKRYFLIGDTTGVAPKDGWRLLIVLPGGDGGADFQPFIKRIYKRALPEGWLVAELVAPQWDARQAQLNVWPTEKSRYPGMQFSTEQFASAVVTDIEKQLRLDSHRIFTLSWSSGGPAAYAIALQTQTRVTGSFVAMSVFKPEQLPGLAAAKGKAFYLLHSPQDFIPIRMAEAARDQLTTAGAQVQLQTYTGGHGWHGDVYGLMRGGIDWLEEHAPKGPSPETTRDLTARLDAARGIMSFNERDAALAGVATSAGAAGAASIAQKAVGQITSFSAHDQAAAEAARLLADAGLCAEAVDIASTMTAFTEKDQALSLMAAKAARLGDAAVTQKALGSINGFSARDGACAAAARILAGNGHRAEALSIARSITNFGQRDALLRELSK